MEAKNSLRLHEAMIVVMLRHRRARLPAESLARRIAKLDLYRRREDGEHAEAWQVVLRARRYPAFFVVQKVGERYDIGFRLRSGWAVS